MDLFEHKYYLEDLGCRFVVASLLLPELRIQTFYVSILLPVLLVERDGASISVLYTELRFWSKIFKDVTIIM